MSSRLPLVLALSLVAACTAEPPSDSAEPASWTLTATAQISGTDALLQAVSPVNDRLRG